MYIDYIVNRINIMHNNCTLKLCADFWFGNFVHIMQTVQNCPILLYMFVSLAVNMERISFLLLYLKKYNSNAKHHASKLFSWCNNSFECYKILNPKNENPSS